MRSEVVQKNIRRKRKMWKVESEFVDVVHLSCGRYHLAIHYDLENGTYDIMSYLLYYGRKFNKHFWASEVKKLNKELKKRHLPIIKPSKYAKVK
jgi:hypothetical protein